MNRCFTNHNLVVDIDDDEEGESEEDVNVLEDRLSDLLMSVDVGIAVQKVSAEEGKSWDDPHHKITNCRKAESHESSHATEGSKQNDELGNTDGSTTPGSLSDGLRL